MNVIVNNIKDSDVKFLIKESVQYVADKLLSKRLQKNLVIFVEQTDDLDIVDINGVEKLCSASCEWIDDWVRPREFKLKINNTDDIYETLVSICHEMVHIKQFVKEELKERFCPQSFYSWKGKRIYKKDIMDYYKRPWEIEAHELETILANDFVKHFVNKVGMKYE